MENVSCILNHDWRYDRKKAPSKRICSKCGEKNKFNEVNNTWYDVSSFSNITETDEVLKNKWVRK